MNTLNNCAFNAQNFNFYSSQVNHYQTKDLLKRVCWRCSCCFVFIDKIYPVRFCLQTGFHTHLTHTFDGCLNAKRKQKKNSQQRTYFDWCEKYTGRSNASTDSLQCNEQCSIDISIRMQYYSYCELISASFSIQKAFVVVVSYGGDLLAFQIHAPTHLAIL